MKRRRGSSKTSEREKVNTLRTRNNARKLYKQIKHLTEGFKPITSSCKDENGNMVSDS